MKTIQIARYDGCVKRIQNEHYFHTNLSDKQNWVILSSRKTQTQRQTQLTRLGRQGSDWADENQDDDDEEEAVSSSSLPAVPFRVNHDPILGILMSLMVVGRRGSLDSDFPSLLDKYSFNSRLSSVIFVYM